MPAEVKPGGKGDKVTLMVAGGTEVEIQCTNCKNYCYGKYINWCSCMHKMLNKSRLNNLICLKKSLKTLFIKSFVRNSCACKFGISEIFFSFFNWPLFQLFILEKNTFLEIKFYSVIWLLRIRFNGSGI